MAGSFTWLEHDIVGLQQAQLDAWNAGSRETATPAEAEEAVEAPATEQEPVSAAEGF